MSIFLVWENQSEKIPFCKTIKNIGLFEQKIKKSSIFTFAIVITAKN